MASEASLDTLGRLFSALAAQPGSLPKYRYASAGTLYPVQAYLSVPPPGLPGIGAGAWYYDPTEHALARLGDTPVPAPDGYEAPFHLLLVAETAAIAPVYPDHIEDFCLLEAGYMAEILSTEAAAAGLALDEAAEPDEWDHAALVAALKLGPSHLHLVAWKGRPA